MFLNDRVETKSNAIHHFWRNVLDRRERLTAKDLAARDLVFPGPIRFKE